MLEEADEADHCGHIGPQRKRPRLAGVGWEGGKEGVNGPPPWPPPPRGGGSHEALQLGTQFVFRLGRIVQLEAVVDLPL